MAKIFARVVIELAGFPKEHIEEVMKKIINKIKEGFEVSKSEIFESVELKDKMAGFWSVFSELEIKFEDINTITVFCFEYMPSSIEIIEPEELRFKSTEVAGFLNDVLARLHEYDMVVKNLQAEKIVMKKKQENKQ
ncbi:MAG: hypothetical protein QT11_C0001G0426 [archaeon GW2011_AR20]|nr:MAG: hypothetical protein QT11_C0001G0426 [archaeon GW2011_AR20]AQS28098.1 hypothetical protein [uncultured archaeon]MBS3160429.1 hypothetical protein [Candidatus Woesearchaeota archaeon]AQS28589.1 hypothetical protein [uncultured archaeon]AQS28699.1 hypothetical protein [uncultured archaeon]